MRKRISIVSGIGKFSIVGLLALVAAACSGEPSDEDNAEVGGERQTPIAAYEVVARDISRQLNLSATVQARVQVNLTSRTQGLVADVFVEESDHVSAGQLLAQFDVSEHQAEFNRAQARAKEAQLELERLQQLRQNQTISISELQRAEAAFSAADAERDLWQTRLDFGAIYAPTDAVVTARYIEVGESLEAQQHLFTLEKMDELVLLPGVSERDIRFLSVGQEVPVRLDALPEQEITGTIRRIFPAADESSRLINVEVLLPAESFEQGVRPGFLARLPLVVDPRPQAIAVPAASVGEDGDTRYVYQVVDEQLVKTTVQLGITRGQWTEVLDGIDVGAIVLATNPIDMRDGTRVRIVNWRG